MFGLQTGTIDPGGGPYNDLASACTIADIYYYGLAGTEPVLETLVNKEAWDSLPPDLQAIVGSRLRP